MLEIKLKNIQLAETRGYLHILLQIWALAVFYHKRDIKLETVSCFTTCSLYYHRYSSDYYSILLKTIDYTKRMLSINNKHVSNLQMTNLLNANDFTAGHSFYNSGMKRDC